MAISAIVMGGGQSKRMGGQDKTLLPVGGVSVMARTVEELRPYSDDIIIAANSTGKYGIEGTREVEDSFCGHGPLGGIHAALLAARHDLAIVTAGDMPRFSGALVPFLLSHWQEGYQMLMPVLDGHGEPLCALYARDCTEAIERMTAENVFGVHRLARWARSLTVDEEALRAAGIDPACFFNMNTPEDFRRCKEKHHEH